VIWLVPRPGDSCGSIRARRILAPHLGQAGGLLKLNRALAVVMASVLWRGGMKSFVMMAFVLN
jgi:hypothetical protein